MRLEVIFFMKKERELDINSIKRKPSIIILKKGQFNNEKKRVLKNIDR